MSKFISFNFKESQNQSLSKKTSYLTLLVVTLSFMKDLNKISLYTCYRDIATTNKNENKLLVPTYRN